MSELQAKFLLGIPPESKNSDIPVSLIDAFKKIGGAKVRYSKRKRAFIFKCLDAYEYIYCNNVVATEVYLPEKNVSTMFRIDSYDEDRKAELYYKRLITQNEAEDLDDDVFWGVSLCKYVFLLTKRTFMLMKRKTHLYKLNKADSPWTELSFKPKHGRPKGSKNKKSLTPEEMERIQQNKDNFERIKETCLKKDRFQEFVWLCKDCGVKPPTGEEFKKMRDKYNGLIL